MRAAVEQFKPAPGSAADAVDAQLYDQVQDRAAQMLRERIVRALWYSTRARSHPHFAPVARLR